MLDHTIYDLDQAISILKTLSQATFAAILIYAEALEIYSLCLPAFGFRAVNPLRHLRRWTEGFFRFGAGISRMIRDFRSGVFYKPIGRKEPVIIRVPNAIQELSEAPELSQRAVYSDIFGFKHTLKNNVIELDPSDQTNATLRYRLFARSIRINGVAQISRLQKHLQLRLDRTCREYLDAQISGEEWTTVKLAPIMRDAATGMMGTYFFGKTMSEEPDFAYAMSRFYVDVVKCMGALQVTPSFMQGSVYSYITKKGHALNILFNRLVLAISSKDGWEDDEELKQITFLSNMIEASKDSQYWTHELLVQAIIGIWFAASHQPWINLHFVFLELCTRPEYIDLIRDELSSQENLDYETIDRLPILDSLMKEAVRLNPLDKMAVRRKAVKPYTFKSTGQHVPVGQIACIPAWDLMHDESKYPDPNVFDGMRFVKSSPDAPPSEVQGTRFTDASKDFPIWGLGSKVCPGRWHSALVMKLVLIHLVKNYDFRLKDANKRYKWFWETFQMPVEDTEVEIRKRTRT